MKRAAALRSAGIGMAACLSLLPMLGAIPQASAATKHKMVKTAIVLNGKTATQPYGFVSGNTMYMPIWYVMNTLQQLGITSTWKNQIWNMKVPSSFSVDTSDIQVGKGAIQLEINGKLMHKVNGIVATDPATGKATTFVPIWYTQQLLKRVGISSPWDGKTWTLEPPTTVKPQPPLPANEVAKWQVAKDILTAFGLSPDTSGTSGYDDISATSTEWGVVHEAIEKSILTPDSTTHSGAYEAADVQTVDTMLWHAYGIQNADYQPGGAPFAWANAVGLNPQGVQATDLLTPQELSQMVSNLADNKRGYHALGDNQYQISYPIEDEATATFNGDSINGQPFFTSNQEVQDAILQTYQFYDAIQVTDENGMLTLTMPSLGGTEWFSYSTALGDIQYQLPGDSTWQTADVLDSRELGAAANTSLQIKVPDDSGLTISVNEMLPQIGGTVSLGDLEVSPNANGLQVQRIDVAE